MAGYSKRHYGKYRWELRDPKLIVIHFAVAGSISITNPAPIAATIEGVADQMGDITAPVDCGQSFPITLAAGGSITCTYASSLPDTTTLTNVATVTTSGPVGGNLGQALVDFDELRIGFTAPREMEFTIHHPGRPSERWTFHRGNAPALDASHVQLGIDQIVEVSIPFALLEASVGDPVQFFVDLRESRQSRDRAPREGEIHFERPSAAFESLMWNA